MEITVSDTNSFGMVSIIIPCYNCETSIRRAVDSVFKQTYTDWELILVDNNSTDNTVHLLDEYAAKYPSKIFTYVEIKKGAPSARNKGLKVAKGKWIQYLDADDELFEDKLERQLKLAAEKQAPIVVGAYFYVLLGTGIKRLLFKPYMGNKWVGLIKSELGRTSANLWEKNKLVAVNGWDEQQNSSQEYDLLFRLLIEGTDIVSDDIPSCNVFAGDNSISRPKTIDSKIRIVNDNLQLRLRIREYLKNNNLWTPMLSECLDLYIYQFLMKEKFKVPSHCNQMIKEMNLKVSVKAVVVGNLKYYTKMILNFIGLRTWIVSR